MQGGADDTISWVWGDIHIHSDGCSRVGGPDSSVYDPNTGIGYLGPASIFDTMEERGVDIGSVLVWSRTGVQEWDGFLDGVDRTDAGHPGKILHYDLEVSMVPGYSAPLMGHLTVLGLGDIRGFGPCPSSGPCPGPTCTCLLWQLFSSSGIPIVNWALDQSTNGGRADLFGVNHTQNWRLDYSFPALNIAPLELPVHVTRENVSFMAVETSEPAELQETGVLSREAWQVFSDLQNSGYRIALAGASDNRCAQSQIGELRTRVIVDNPVNYASYLAGIKAGRTIVSAGRRIFGDGFFDNELVFSINRSGQPRKYMGDELAVSAGELLEVNISGKSQGGTPGLVQLIANGEIVRQWTHGGARGNFVYQITDLQLQKSSWVTVRAPRAETSPIYVMVNGAPIRGDWRSPCRMLQHMNTLIYHQAPGLIPQDIIDTYYVPAWHAFAARAIEAGQPNCPLVQPPQLPPPGPPAADCEFPNDEGNGAAEDYGDTFLAPKVLPAFTGTPLNELVTGRLFPRNENMTKPPWEIPDPPPPAPPYPTLECSGAQQWPCPDQDYFRVAATCRAGGGTHLRARAVLMTQEGKRQENSNISLDEHVVRYCWSDNVNSYCEIDGVENYFSSRVYRTTLGGGTSLNVPIDVACTPGSTYYLMMSVHPNYFMWLANRPAVPACPENQSGQCCDQYALHYEIEQVDDGFPASP
ncbi:MAG: hypothetical protein MJD61_06310 [Proteobacteria bacterium]|nr:hypothetical protein [Pseudomonadota bacterium]